MKIGVSSSKRRVAGGQVGEAKNSRSSNGDGERRVVGPWLRFGKRTARVAPAQTVFVGTAANSGFGAAKKRRSLALEERMALNRSDDEKQGVVDAELSPENNGERQSMCMNLHYLPVTQIA